jgi:hypothetical protein
MSAYGIVKFETALRWDLKVTELGSSVRDFKFQVTKFRIPG